MYYLIGKKEVGKKWLNFGWVTNIFYGPKFFTDFFYWPTIFTDLVSSFFADFLVSFLSALRSKMPQK